jgi:hypothetical protein
MARSVLEQSLGADLQGVSSAEQLFKNNRTEIRDLVRERMTTLFGAWMSQIGHGRPFVPGGPDAAPGLTVEEATSKAADITKQIDALVAPESGSAPEKKG